MPAPVDAGRLAQVTLRVGDQKGNSRSLLRSAGLDDGRGARRAPRTVPRAGTAFVGSHAEVRT